MICMNKTLYAGSAIVLTFFLFALSCAPKIVIDTISNNTYPKTEDYRAFAVLEKYADLNKAEIEDHIGSVQIKEKGLSINCDYKTVLALAEKQAREMGGNCLVITEHKEPDFRSTCHRISCDVLRIINPENYEKEILWHPNRPLTIADFKGSIDKRPFQATTYSGITYYASGNPISGKVTLTVKSLFDCHLSYFKPSDIDNYILKHEQLHFDITEIYTRQFRREIIESNMSYKEFNTIHQELFSSILKELSLKQDEYDAEVYADRSLQEKWNKWVAKTLDELKDYSDVLIEL